MPAHADPRPAHPACSAGGTLEDRPVLGWRACWGRSAAKASVELVIERGRPSTTRLGEGIRCASARTVGEACSIAQRISWSAMPELPVAASRAHRRVDRWAQGVFGLAGRSKPGMHVSRRRRHRRGTSPAPARPDQLRTPEPTMASPATPLRTDSPPVTSNMTGTVTALTWRVGAATHSSPPWRRRLLTRTVISVICVPDGGEPDLRVVGQVALEGDGDRHDAAPVFVCSACRAGAHIGCLVVQGGGCGLCASPTSL
jgi:hypothetical protein